jgi:hypothetical protein
MSVLRCLAVVSMLIVPATFVAHHDLSKSYDLSKSVTVAGFVSKVDWSSPHAFVRVFVKNQGKTEAWDLEAGTPDELALVGGTREFLKVGAAIKVTANPALNDIPGKGYITKIERADGLPMLIAKIW